MATKMDNIANEFVQIKLIRQKFLCTRWGEKTHTSHIILYQSVISGTECIRAMIILNGNAYTMCRNLQKTVTL